MTSHFDDLSDATYQLYRERGLDKTILALASVMMALQSMHELEQKEAQLPLEVPSD